jgi:delta-aminolevulinic acid dehydratase/porphobilinogen synthase
MAGVAGEQPLRHFGRRLTSEAETELDVSDLMDVIHVRSHEGAGIRAFGGETRAYDIDTVGTLPDRAAFLRQMGLSRVLVQAYPDPYIDAPHAIQLACSAVQVLRELMPHAQIMIDAAGLCMGVDRRWGLRDPGTDEVLPEATLAALTLMAEECVLAGANGIVVVGRLAGEVRAARAGVDAVGPGGQVWGFSSNPETVAAYFDPQSHRAGRHHTGQKLLVGNGTEMLLRICRDAFEGMDTMVQKPIEGTGFLAAAKALTTSRDTTLAFLNSTSVKALRVARPDFFEGAWMESHELHQRMSELSFGAYEVSGSYVLARLVEDHLDPDLAAHLVAEQWLATKWAAGDRYQAIISRQAPWMSMTEHVRNATRDRTDGTHLS